MEEIKWLEKVTNEQVPTHIGEKRTFLINILLEKSIGVVIFLEEIAFFMMSLKDILQK